MVARVCLDMLRSRNSRHEEPLEVDALDPIVSSEEGIDPTRLSQLDLTILND